MKVRSPDFAGSWYPGREGDCREAIEELSKIDIPCPSTEKEKIGGIVPHAGWFYSGKIACSVIKCLRSDQPPDTIVLFGKHLHPGSNNYIMKEGAWDTPLGELEIDSEMANMLISDFSFQVETASKHDQDNTIELQLPFVKYFYPDTKILPIGVPPSISSMSIGRRVAEISQDLGKKVFILGSTDLTHYGYNYGFIPKGVGEEAVDWVKKENDRKLIDRIIQMDAEGVINESLQNQNACCGGAVATAIKAANKLGASIGEQIIYSTSYDIRPDNSFVGYVGVVFS